MKQNAGGSLTIYVQNNSPGSDKDTNWLPAPRLTFRSTYGLNGRKRELRMASGRLRTLSERNERTSQPLFLRENSKLKRELFYMTAVELSNISPCLTPVQQVLLDLGAPILEEAVVARHKRYAKFGMLWRSVRWVLLGITALVTFESLGGN